MLKSFAVLFLGIVAGTAFGQDKSTGCGPGWYVTKSYTWLATSTRNTTNSYIQPFATTSGTSGCNKHTIVYNERRGFEFLETNYDQVAQDAAMGRGEYLAALGRSLGCQGNDLTTFQTVVRAEFGTVFLAATPETAFHSLRAVMAQDSRLKGCRI